MWHLFLAIFGMLVIASGVTALFTPEQQNDKPILYWVTDANPARIEQVELFHEWMVENGHTAPDGTSTFELRLDTANAQPAKRIIQSVSGVAGDIMDKGGGGEMRFFRSIGVLENITDDALRMGFDPSHTYPAAHDEFVVDGRQYTFPCNLSAYGVWVNLEVFERAGMPPPPYQWTLDEFESIGKELSRRANAGKRRKEVFLFAQAHESFYAFTRSTGLDRFNETMTRCTLDDPRYVELLKRAYQWTFKDNIVPTPSDTEAFSAQQAGYGGDIIQWFVNGNVAAVVGGRYSLIQLRQINEDRRRRGVGPMKLAVVEIPHAGFPNTTVASRSPSIFVGSQHKDLAKLFLKFLTSEKYNMHIVADADSLPPDPAFARTEAFLRPPDHPEEWGLHEPWAKMMLEIAIPEAYSPFILDGTYNRLEQDTRAAFFAHRLTAEETGRRTAEIVNREFERFVSEEPPELQARYARALADQKRIEELRATGEVVPLELITNPFHRKYYVEKGWAK